MAEKDETQRSEDDDDHDEDYEPSDEDRESDEEPALASETIEDPSEYGNKRKKGTKAAKSRDKSAPSGLGGRRRGGIQLSDDEGEDEKPTGISTPDPLFAESSTEPKSGQKTKVDEIWEQLKSSHNKSPSPMQDVSFPAEDSKPSSSGEKKIEGHSAPGLPSAQTSLDSPSAGAASTSSKGKVTITQTVEFAGEKIKVVKTLDANSKEAAKAASQGRPAVAGLKKGGMESLLARIKPQKISTIEKSKMDWTKYKTATGCEDEVKQYVKDGYLEKKAFLERTEIRQWEAERDAKRKRPNPPS